MDNADIQAAMPLGEWVDPHQLLAAIEGDFSMQRLTGKLKWLRKSGLVEHRKEVEPFRSWWRRLGDFPGCETKPQREYSGPPRSRVTKPRFIPQNGHSGGGVMTISLAAVPPWEAR